MPDLLVSLSQPDLLQDCCFHPCVRLAKWTNSKALSFVPPDGRFVLMEYRLATPTSPTVMPLSIQPIHVTTGEQGGTFSFTVQSRTQPFDRPLENVTLTFLLGKSAMNVQASISGGRSASGRTSPNGEAGQLTGGRWEFEPASGLLIWRIARLSIDEAPATLSGTWTSRSVFDHIS